ncbi:MAG: hypothetical protein BA867_03885 [Desulfobacterales bacterium S5133MH16]|nr:MAG: hypothetical protein BA867_03885 [Desulfobacterales bacterium S5133MH16]
MVAVIIRNLLLCIEVIEEKKPMTTDLKKVLIVDDDPAILGLLSKSLSIDNERYEVLTAESGNAALEIISREDIFLVVSDVKMPGITGLHLLAKIRANYPQVKVILMTGFSSEEIRSQVKDNRCLHFLEKPFSTDYLIELIREQIDIRDKGFEGTLKNIQLTDLIQMCCLSALSMGISVSKGSEKGIIYIQDGDIIHAECEDSVGENAFYEIMAWEGGSFETMGVVAAQETTIDKNYQYLLLEVVRMADEKAVKKDDEDENEEKINISLPHENIRVLIVDDSPMMCKILSDIIESDEEMEVAGTAGNGEEALKKIGELEPDIITLDVNMPVMGGSTALKHIMIKSPCPVVIISSIGSNSQMNVIDFLCLGAVDFIKKPVKNDHFIQQQKMITKRIRLVAKAKINNFQRAKTALVLSKKDDKSDENLPCDCLVVFHSGAGGYTELIKTVSVLPGDLNACLILLQTMPSEFINPFTEYIDKRSLATILPLQNDSPLLGGRCYVGTSEYSLKLNSLEKGYFLCSESEVSKSGQTDKFLKSIADCYAKDVLVVLMSGADVGDLDGLRSIKEKSGRIIAQKLNSCMVPYPLEKAIEAGLVDQEASHVEIARQIADK